MTISDLVTAALTEIRVARAGDVVAAETLAYGLLLYNGLLDQENADRREVYATTQYPFTLVPNLSPHTIGPTGTFVTPIRPVSLEFAQVNLGGGPPNVLRPMVMRDVRWYVNQTVPLLTSTFPTDVYYEKDWPNLPANGAPNGKLYFWPVPTTAYPVVLWARVLLANVLSTSTFTLPPGYLEYHRLLLAKKLAPGFGQTMAQSSLDELREIRAMLFGNNEETPRLYTADSGIPNAQKRGGIFDWLTRTVE